MGRALGQSQHYRYRLEQEKEQENLLKLRLSLCWCVIRIHALPVNYLKKKNGNNIFGVDVA